MLESKTILPMLPKSWKKSFNNAIVVPAKMRRCEKYRGKILRATWNNQINENKEVAANLHLFKREAPNEFGYMLPSFIE